MSRMLRDIFAASGPVIGSICSLPSAHSAEIMARSGFDWLFLDLQHGMIGRETLVQMLRAVDTVQLPAMVRVPWNRPEAVGWVLDAGAQGVVAPMVNTAEQATALVAACRYAPLGIRSWGPARPSLTQPDYDPHTANTRVVVCPMIETQEAIGNLEAILGVEGVDVILVGQSDLSIAFGLHPQQGRSDAGHIARLASIASMCRKHNIPAIINCSGATDARDLLDLGFRNFLVDTDAAILRRYAREKAKEMRTLFEG